MPLSVPAMWDITWGRGDSKLPPVEYQRIERITRALFDLQFKYQVTPQDYHTVNDHEFLRKLDFINEDLGSKALTFTWLMNFADVSFEQIFDKVGQSLDDTVVYCNNAGVNCTNMKPVKSGNFPRCFEYATLENRADGMW